MDKKLGIVLLVEALIGLAVAVALYVSTNGQAFRDLLPPGYIAIWFTIFVMLFTLFIASVGELIRSRGKQYLFFLAMVIVAIVFFYISGL